MRVTIVGGGVAGSATAAALAGAGVEVTVLEGRDRLDPEEGSVVTVAPNGMDALEALGGTSLREAVTAHGTPTDGHDLLDARGRLLGQVSLGVPLADGSRGATLKRSRLAVELADLAARRGADLRLGASVTDVDVDRGRVTTTSGDVLDADLVVGADGVWSGVRRALDPGAKEPRYLGLLNFGGVTRGAAAGSSLPDRRWQMTFGKQAFFGAHRSGDDVLWFVNLPAARPDREVSEGDWLPRLAAVLEDDAGPGAELVRAGELELTAHGTFDVARVSTWHCGVTGLVGDAAHAPSPTSGQGASLAVEDAVVLARTMAAGEGWAAFEAARRSRVEKVVAEGARATSAKTPGPVGRALRDPMLRAVFRWLATEKNGAWLTGQRLSATSGVRAPRADGAAR